MAKLIIRISIPLLLIVGYSSLSIADSCCSYTMHPVRIVLKSGISLLGYVQKRDCNRGSPYKIRPGVTTLYKKIFEVNSPNCLGKSNCVQYPSYIVADEEMVLKIKRENIAKIMPYKILKIFSGIGNINVLPIASINRLLENKRPVEILSSEGISGLEQFYIISYNQQYSGNKLRSLQNEAMKEVFIIRNGILVRQDRNKFFSYNDKYKNKNIIFILDEGCL